MSRLLDRRISKLETRSSVSGLTIFVCTGVPRANEVGDLAVAVTQRGWAVKNAGETDGQFQARLNGADHARID